MHVNLYKTPERNLFNQKLTKVCKTLSPQSPKSPESSKYQFQTYLKQTPSPYPSIQNGTPKRELPICLKHGTLNSKSNNSQYSTNSQISFQTTLKTISVSSNRNKTQKKYNVDLKVKSLITEFEAQFKNNK